MAPQSTGVEIVEEIKDTIRIYKDGSVERFLLEGTVPASTHPQTGVQSKDVVISPQTGVSVRLYIPESPDPKLPLLLYFHGGAFCFASAFHPMYHDYLNSLVAAARVVAVSVDYRRAPEHPLPAAFDDSWEALKWAVSDGGGDEWVKSFADLNRVFFAGDSAGANIAYRMGLRSGLEGLPSGARLVGNILVHPFFGGEVPVRSEVENPDFKLLCDKLWRLACPSATSFDDPIINPVVDPNIGSMGGGERRAEGSRAVFLGGGGKERLEGDGGDGGNGWRGTYLPYDEPILR